MNPRVFIGIPTFNRPHYLRATIASLRAQTLGAWRAIVSDNDSPPAAAAAARAAVEAAGDPRLSYVLQPENGGEYGQGRFFFGAARDEDYFVILHDDDLLRPDYLETALRTLDRRPHLAYFHCAPAVIDADGRESAELTRWYSAYHGQEGVSAGEIVVLDRLLRTGFTPICGTCFRLSRLRESGFVDPDLGGNYPFELNVLLRLGERGLRAWYSPERRIVFRVHPGALRNADRLMENAGVVDAMITLLGRRRFTGANERFRRRLLSRLHRARAVMELRAGRIAPARAALREAVAHNRFSRGTLLAAAFLLAPRLTARLLPPPRPVACPPGLAPAAAAARLHPSGLSR